MNAVSTERLQYLLQRYRANRPSSAPDEVMRTTCDMEAALEELLYLRSEDELMRRNPVLISALLPKDSFVSIESPLQPLYPWEVKDLQDEKRTSAEAEKKDDDDFPF